MDQQQPKGRKGGEARIPLYTGKAGDNFHVWLKSFKLGARACQWNNATQLIQLPTFFTELAALKWDEIPESTVEAFTMTVPPSANDIIAYLKELFDDKGEAERCASLVYDTKQGTGSVSDFAFQFQDLLRRAYPGEELGESQKKFLFIRGLREELRRKVEFKNPQSFEQALREALYFESLSARDKTQGRSGCAEEVNMVTLRNYRENNYGLNPYQPLDGRRSRMGRGARERAFLRNQERLQQPRNAPHSIMYNGGQRQSLPEYTSERSSKVQSTVNRMSNDLLLMGEEIGPATVTKLYMENVKTIALIDSGATCTIISEALAKKIVMNKRWNVADASAHSASGHTLAFTRSAQMNITFDHETTIQHKVHVLEKAPYPCIIGTDLMSKLGELSIDYEKGCIKLGSRIVLPLESRESFRNKDKIGSLAVRQINLIASESVAIAPWGQTHMWVGINDVENGRDIAIDETSVGNKLKEHGILLAKSIGTVTKGHVPVTFLNTSVCKFDLIAGATVGTGEVIPQRNVQLVGSISHAPVKQKGNDPLKKIDLSKSDLSHQQKREMLSFLEQNVSVFGLGTGNPGQTGKVYHHIDTGGHVPLHTRAHRTPFSQKQKVKELVTEMIKVGIARPSSSPWSSPIVLVKKKSGEDRFCVDYRRLNDITKKDTYPLPKISELLDSLGKSKFFSTLDLDKGYWQIPMSEKDKEKTAFITPEGLFEFNVMPFGLTNAPATFQRMMDVALSGLQGDSCLVYLDDIIVFSETFDAHVKKLKDVFRRLNQYSLKLNAKKCHFAKEAVLYLGHMVSKHGMQPDPQKTELVRSFPVPTTKKQLERFLGLASFYRRFVKGFASIAHPLDMLRKKEVEFTWSPECQVAFDRLKSALVMTPVLIFPDFNKPFLLETDASGTGVGAILSQETWDERKKKHVHKPVAYASRRLTNAEAKYHATEREALAIMYALKYFRVYVYGNPVKLVSDHAPLQWLMTNKSPTGRLARWAVELQEYDLVRENGKAITYKPGKAIGHVDACSRMFEINGVIESDGALHLEAEQEKDEWCNGIMEKLKKGKRIAQFSLENGILHHWPTEVTRASCQFPSQIAVPLSLRKQILKLCHDNLFGGHMGCNRTYDKVSLRYFWPRMKEDCEMWVKTCSFCQKRKGPQKETKEFLTPLASCEPFAKLVVDVLGPLPLSENGNRYIVIFTDHFTKYVEAFAVPTHTAKVIAQLLVSKVICRHGAPCELLSDQGPEFMSSLVKEICQICNIEKINSTAYHPQTQGLTERFNRTIMGILKGYVNENQTNWDTFIPFALWAYHNSKQKSLKESPFFLVYGRDSRMPSDVAFQAKRPLYIDLEEDLKEKTKHQFSVARALAKNSLDHAKETMKANYDRAADSQDIQQGDRVSLHRPAVPPGKSPKLWVYWTGPFEVVQVKKPNALLYDHASKKPAFWVHLNRVKPFYDRYKTDEPENSNSEPKTHQPKKLQIAPEQTVTFGHTLRSGKTYGSNEISALQIPHPHRQTRHHRYFYANNRRIGDSIK